jgi:hypothetical protein
MLESWKCSNTSLNSYIYINTYTIALKQLGSINNHFHRNRSLPYGIPMNYIHTQLECEIKDPSCIYSRSLCHVDIWQKKKKNMRERLMPGGSIHRISLSASNKMVSLITTYTLNYFISSIQDFQRATYRKLDPLCTIRTLFIAYGSCWQSSSH